jgi:hypothetical protein
MDWSVRHSVGEEAVVLGAQPIDYPDKPVQGSPLMLRSMPVRRFKRGFKLTLAKLLVGKQGQWGAPLLCWARGR